MLMLCLKIKDEEKDVREGEGVVEGEEDGVEGKGEGGRRHSDPVRERGKKLLA